MNSSNYNKFFLPIIVFLLFTSKVYAKSNVKFLSGANVPTNIIFFDEEKNQYSLDQFEGKTILLVFWGTLFSACIDELPDLDLLQKDFRNLSFEIIPLSEEETEIIKKCYKKYKIRYLPIYQDYDNQLFRVFNIVGRPTSILIDSKGKMVASFTGSTKWHDEKIREIILSFIPGNHPEPKNSYNEQSLNKPLKPLPSIKNETNPETKNEQNNE
ncbi:MAG: TlpA family protein disulfide reductase [Rickettsia endosymbiont of Pentastiridius leporinus]